MRMRAVVGGLAGAVLCMLAGCSSTGASADAAAGQDAPTTGGMCGADTPAGQECTSLKATGAAVAATCMTGTLPTGQGGTIINGTYVLTAVTYYNRTTCPTIAISETIAFAGGCLDLAAGTPFSATFSGPYTVSGVNFMATQACVHLDIDSGTVRPDVSMKTFTATPTTFTLISRDAPDAGISTNSVVVYTKQ